MRRGLIALVVMVLAGCSGVSDGPPLPTVDPVATDPPTTTSESGEVPVTEVVVTSSPTTLAPTTTVDAEAAAIASVEQAALDAYAAYHAAILDPSNPELRAEVERTHAEGALEGVIEILDNLIAAGQVFRPHPELRPRTEVVGAVRFIDGDPNFADLIVCNFNPESVVEVGAAPDGSDALVRDDVFTVKNVLAFKLIDGRWFFTGGDSITEAVGDVGCE